MARGKIFALAFRGLDFDATRAWRGVEFEPRRVRAPSTAGRRALILRAAASHIMPGPLARVLEALDQALDGIAVGFGLAADVQRALEPVDDGGQQIEALDALRGPVGGNLVAGHAPHLLGVGLEEDLEQPLAELVAHPFVEGARDAIGKALA